MSNSNAGAVGAVYAQGLFSVSGKQNHYLGTRKVLDDGREFVYCQSGSGTNGIDDAFGGTDITAGHLLQTAAVNTVFEDMAIATIALGATSIAVTPGAGTAVKDLYAGGMANVTDEAGQGFMYRIDNHAAVSSATEFTLYLSDSVREAIVAAGTLTMTVNPCKAVIQSPVTTPTGQPIGVSPVDVDVSVAPFHWVQVKGPASVLIAGTLVNGEPVTYGAAVAGSVAPYNEDGTANYAPIGHSMAGLTDTEYGTVYLHTGF